MIQAQLLGLSAVNASVAEVKERQKSSLLPVIVLRLIPDQTQTFCCVCQIFWAGDASGGGRCGETDQRQWLLGRMGLARSDALATVNTATDNPMHVNISKKFNDRLDAL
jgi:hypothetical protein